MVPCVTPQEIRRHLSSRYHFQTPLPLVDAAADCPAHVAKLELSGDAPPTRRRPPAPGRS